MRIECDEILIGCSLVDDWLSALHQSQREVKQKSRITFNHELESTKEPRYLASG